MIFHEQLLSRSGAALALALLGAGAPARADTYNIPAALTSAPFNCTLAWGEYNCPSLSFDKETDFILTAPVTINVSGDFDAAKEFTTINNGKKFKLVIAGHATFAKDLSGEFDLTAAGNVKLQKDARVKGNLTVSGDLIVAKDSIINGNVVVSGDLNMGKDSAITGTCTVGGQSNYVCGGVAPPVPTLHHVRLDHEGTGLTCQPSVITVTACSTADSNGTCTPFQGGMSGSVTAMIGASTYQTLNYTIPANSSQTTVSLSSTAVQTYTLSASNTYTCWNGTGASCNISFAQAGFEFSDIPNHRSGTELTRTISAISTTANKACKPAFTGNRDVYFSCKYVNPTKSTGQVGLAFGDTYQYFSCGGTQTKITVPFNSEGVATFRFVYKDAGKVTLQAATGTPPPMNGSDTFVAVPNAFIISAASGAPVNTAGEDLKFAVSAVNTAGEVTQSYGKEEPSAEGATATLARCAPTASGTAVGTFTNGSIGAFENGIAKSSGFAWSEVGNVSIAAVNTEYLDTGMSITGATKADCSDAFTRVRPNHFATELATTNKMAYSGQPFPVKVIARNKAGTPTVNYAGSYAHDVTLSAWSDQPTPVVDPGPGELTDNVVTASSFSGGSASAKPKYKFSSNKTGPHTIRILAKDLTDGIGHSTAANSYAKMPIRVGRLRLSNAFGSAGRNLSVPMRAEYWTGNSWLLNSDDDFTHVPADAFALTLKDKIEDVAALSSSKLVAGQATVTLRKPKNNLPGRADIAANLGTATVDESCNDMHPPSVGADLIWLRARNGNCKANDKEDPAARATFGISTPENKATIHVREAFN